MVMTCAGAERPRVFGQQTAPLLLGTPTTAASKIVQPTEISHRVLSWAHKYCEPLAVYYIWFLLSATSILIILDQPKMRALLLFVSSVLFLGCDGSDWHCGTFGLEWPTELLAGNCAAKSDVNQCCLKHDQCYSQQLGRVYCDDIFCRCVNSALQVCGSPTSMHAYCTAVKVGGFWPYFLAGKKRWPNTGYVLCNDLSRLK
jgi:hypothetical protein